jgi:hypothetical protein
MSAKPERDVEKGYPKTDFVAKLRRLADAIENGDRFEIQIAGERISVPVRAQFTIGIGGWGRCKDGRMGTLQGYIGCWLVEARLVYF